MSHRLRAQSPQGTVLCRMATDHGVAARFYLLVVVFCRSGILMRYPVACLGLRASSAPACRVPLAQWLERWSYDHRSWAHSPQGTMLCRMATDHGVAVRFYLLVIVFCRSGIFCLPWLLAGLQTPPSGQADSGTAPLSNSWKLLGRPNAILQPCSKGRTR